MRAFKKQKGLTMLEEAKSLLKLINNGSAWQLEGAVGRRCNEFIEAELIVPDDEKPDFVFNSPYYGQVKSKTFKLNYERIQEVELCS